MFVVGEQPGDVEDREGEPFVGPAGHLLDRAFEQAGIAREQLYLTNAVKHFRWKPARDSKRRLHETPARRHIVACRPWLIAELNALRPDVVLVLGAVAAHALLGDGFRLTEHRGQWLDIPAALHEVMAPQTSVLATVHPSAVLRAQDRDAQLDAFVADLKTAGTKLVSG
jgi:DNA polymerase